MDRISLTQHGKWLPADVQTTISLYMGLVGDQPGILLESAEVDGRLGRYSLIAWDYRLTLHPVEGKLVVDVADERLAPLKKLEGMDYLSGVKKAVETLSVTQETSGGNARDGLPGLTRGLYGYFGYGVAGMFERKLADCCKPADAEACLVLPGQMVLFDHLRHSCCYLSLDKGATPMPAPIQWGADLTAPEAGTPTVHPGKEEYMAGVERCKELIAEGECIQVVLSTRFTVPLPDEPFKIYRRLRQANPSPFMFYMKFPDCPSMGKTCGTTLLGSSPEMMVRSTAGQLEVRPIAGTRWRGETEKEDRRLEEELLADPKERAEHVMLVDLGRNDLGRISKPGTVTVEQFMNVERFSHVMHLTSYVEGELKDGLDGVDVLQATFPAGTLSGAPKIRAMEIIAELEPQDRGPYGGCIGWMGLDDGVVSLDTGITIRSMWIRNGKCHWQAGAGIVYDSNAESEWNECQNKARVIQEVITGKGGTDVLLIDNFDSFTFNLVQAFQQLGADPVVIRNDREEILDLAASGKLERVVLSPGPSNPQNAGYCLEFLARLPKAIPVLGVCLGHQTLGHFAGAPVERAERIMHGKTSMVYHEGRSVFAGLDSPFEVCRYHSLIVPAHKAADMLEVTARTKQGEVMGIQYKDRPWHGVQFHPESILTPDGPKLLQNFLNMKG